MGGDAILLEKLTNKFNLGDSIKDVFTGAIDSNDLPNILKDGTYKGDKGNLFDYEQKILLGDLVLSKFRDVDYEDLMGLTERTTVVGVKIPSNTLVITYSLDFMKNLPWYNLGGTKIYLLGKDYVIEDVGLGSGFNLVSGKDRLTLEDNKNIRLNGKVINDVTVLFVKSSNGDLDKINIEWRTDDEQFLTTERELVMPGFEALKFNLAEVLEDSEEGTYGKLYLIGGDFSTKTWRC